MRAPISARGERASRPQPLRRACAPSRARRSRRLPNESTKRCARGAVWPIAGQFERCVRLDIVASFESRDAGSPMGCRMLGKLSEQ
jgi:hypothetical protein